MTDHARVVVIGGGVVGVSVAYHLARLGWRDVRVLERRTLTCGTTWHAAGLVGRLRGSRTASRLVQYSAELYARLPAETGCETGWRRCGSLIVARTAERLTQLRRSVALARAVDIDAQIIAANDVPRHWPLCRADDLAGAMLVPDDGRVIPADVTQALAAGARASGATIREEVAVGAVIARDGAVTGVETSQGAIACEAVRAISYLAVGMDPFIRLLHFAYRDHPRAGRWVARYMGLDQGWRLLAEIFGAFETRVGRLLQG